MLAKAMSCSVKQAGLTPGFDLASLAGGDGSTGFVINGVAEHDRSGTSVASAGDVNGDGIDDLIIGAWRADPNGNSSAGASYVVFGKRDGFDANFDLASLATGDGSTGFVINGIAEQDKKWGVRGQCRRRQRRRH